MKNIAAFLVVLIVAAPVFGEGIIPRTGPATAEREGKFSGDPARRTMDQFAACVLDRKRRMVLEALALPSDSPEQNELFGKLAKVECIASAQMHFNGPAFRGSLYKALVRKEFGRKDVFPAPGADIQQTGSEEIGTRVPGEAGLLKFASCVIHKDPVNARGAILATAGSDVEDAAMAALATVYGQCLYQDDTIRFSKVRLLGLLAEAYYRDASAAAGVAAAQ